MSERLMMTITAALAYVLIAGYFVIERSLRQGQQSLSLKPGPDDAGSSQVLWISGMISIVLVMAAPALNSYQIGCWSHSNIGWLGLILMLGGLTMRYWAAKTLGNCYTRTLQIVEGQEIVAQAPYSLIRHPGYFGTLLMEIGAGLAVENWIVLLVATIIGIASRTYRINAEEKMLSARFAEQYEAYSAKTWKLVPFLY
jgi:protein-S-isoprenylcysteine O-methyltransferase Ste14